MATSGDFSIGISAEEKLALPLDELIQKTKKHKLKTKTTESKVKITQKKSKNLSHKQKNVKKTVIVPIPKVARAKANAAFASAKRQTVINKRRPGLVLVAKKGKKVVPTVQLRPFKTSAARKQLKESKAAIQRGIDVSNIINHFRSHPKKFDVPKGSNLRITINLNNVKPVVGGKK
ncbi:chitobiosyldiphosphodolichol beta [Plasmopara halstedii]|uniref:Chitobiosyldiphosphodolichol beta n=1 Tax=Plasmopara halstedii TaxID=4781 RepID=A0A0N7L786_PLAHL|nr:chitobiosyldiphosphodolichol beta [Plasmopara halstedii]CEG46379.1 chitobiosyldiphosphodolichol beta [Plasmopara halstedii]|eukprot:XP_024582748.1 chitobiosyldiphosphodolichol beta [Plasmopara halstedii]